MVARSVPALSESHQITYEHATRIMHQHDLHGIENLLNSLRDLSDYGELTDQTVKSILDLSEKYRPFRRKLEGGLTQRPHQISRARAEREMGNVLLEMAHEGSSGVIELRLYLGLPDDKLRRRYFVRNDPAQSPVPEIIERIQAKLQDRTPHPYEMTITPELLIMTTRYEPSPKALDAARVMLDACYRARPELINQSGDPPQYTISNENYPMFRKLWAAEGKGMLEKLLSRP
jgi:hypothetical protein